MVDTPFMSDDIPDAKPNQLTPDILSDGKTDVQVSAEADSTELGSGPNEAIQAELSSYLTGDDSRLGQVYRGLQQGWTAAQIAADLQVSTAGFVYNQKATIATLLEGQLPNSANMALQTIGRVRSIMRSSGLSAITRQYLEAKIEELELLADDPQARAKEAQHAKDKTKQAEATNEVGIYVYALPHYLRYRFDPKSRRTLMKVGRSDSDVITRFRNQTRTTALPEEPILLRIYPTETPSPAVEKTFHGLLKTADMSPNLTRVAGKEWFITKLEFLDEIARALDLEVHEVNSDELVDED
ncbi:MAG TPA: GIY-YIG nuclease family protein [Pyrinomonadaceae bacterium]|nr:GIY-YIG nuclease family protein [Pyrinomonadaceae bacterium]